MKKKANFKFIFKIILAIVLVIFPIILAIYEIFFPDKDTTEIPFTIGINNEEEFDAIAISPQELRQILGDRNEVGIRGKNQILARAIKKDPFLFIFVYIIISALVIIHNISKNGEENEQKFELNYTERIVEIKKNCLFCDKEINVEDIICSHCGKNIQEHENALKIKKEKEYQEKYRNIKDIFNDEVFMEEAKELRRIYGKKVFISYLKNKAMELGLKEINLNEEDIE